MRKETMSSPRPKSPGSSLFSITDRGSKSSHSDPNNSSFTLLRSVLRTDNLVDDDTTRSSLISSIHRLDNNSSATTIWNESDEDDTDRADDGNNSLDAFPPAHISAEASITSASTLSFNLVDRNSSAAKGELHISSRLERYGIVKRNYPPSKLPTSQIQTAPLHVQVAVEEIHRWLFVEGGHFEDVQTLMTQYSNYIRDEFGIPLDRLYYGGVGLHPKLTAYLWRWEPDDFEHREMPQEVFERRTELFSPDEPFCVLEQGRAEFIRIKDTDEYIPPDTEKWFRSGGYKDYFALPDIHRGQSKGGLAWSTKRPEGFSDDDLQFFRLTQPALTTIMRLHTNDLVLKTLTERMEKEIEDRTTELATANQQLAQANTHISQQSSKQLEHFASMSHEIRTPLNCILGLSSLLAESDDLPAVHRDSVKMIHGSADLLSGVVDDVLDYSKLESGHFDVDIQPTDLQSALDTVVHSISNKSMGKNVNIRTSYCGRLPRMIDTDSRRLQQILYNLLGNACKFSRDGRSIDLSVDIVTGHSENKLRLSVKDYGKGIDENDLENIFRPFSQASKETQTVYGGTGLGLSITRKLVSKLGGTISVKSELGKYSQFVVELPYDGQLVDLSTFKNKFTDTTIVIVDEAEKFSNTYSMEDEFMPLPRSVVQAAGLNVLRCPNFDDLERKLERGEKTTQYVLIVQHALAQESGVERIKSIIGAEKCSWFVTGNEDERSSFDFRSIKSLATIFPSILLQSLSENVVSNRAILAPVSDDATSSRPTIPESDGAKTASAQVPKPDQMGSLKVLYAEDNLVNQKVLRRVLERLGLTDITIVDNGLKAVESCETTKYDLIFMDMQMPVMDGLEACERIVSRNADEKVVFVTAHALDDFRAKAVAAGATDFVSKPFNVQRIGAILKNIEK